MSDFNKKFNAIMDEYLNSPYGKAFIANLKNEIKVETIKELKEDGWINPNLKEISTKQSESEVLFTNNLIDAEDFEEDSLVFDVKIEEEINYLDEMFDKRSEGSLDFSKLNTKTPKSNKINLDSYFL